MKENYQTISPETPKMFPEPESQEEIVPEEEILSPNFEG
jgi:hypothetical protein